MGIIAWIILGMLAGAIAKAIYPGRQGGGLISTILLGVFGAFLGGALHSLISTGSLQLMGASLTIPGIILATIGAIITIFLWQKIQHSA
jgi:uncharacterized membrane protein YeaQ/YmgE (transglycosylase-associated protein family)